VRDLRQPPDQAAAASVWSARTSRSGWCRRRWSPSCVVQGKEDEERTLVRA